MVLYAATAEMWMRNIALASQTGKNGTQRQQSFHDAPASGCLLFVQFPGHSPMFSHGYGRFNAPLNVQHVSCTAVFVTVSFNPADQWCRPTK